MKYFVCSYNYLTLFKALIYAEKEWGIGNTHIIYSSFIMDPPKGLCNTEYNTYIIDSDIKISCTPLLNNNVKYITRLINEKRIVHNIVRYIDDVEKNDLYKDICLVVFRDNLVRETLLIDLIKKKYFRARIYMIEEGLALYSSYKKPVYDVRLFIRIILHVLMRVPVLPLKGLPHGCNKKIDKIICRRPNELKGKLQDRGDNIFEEPDVFCRDNCSKFISKILMMEIYNNTYDYVFLTQPLFPRNNPKINKKYDEFLKDLFSITCKYGTLLIKQHPCDKWDYSVYQSDSVSICEQSVAMCPFECLMGYYGNPQTITLFSSAACNILTSKPNLFLYDLFPDIIRSDCFSNEFLLNNNIKRCKSLGALEESLNKKRNCVDIER